jgi:GT2 family glycosyltransferase
MAPDPGDPESLPAVTVVVVTDNSADVIDACLDAVLPQLPADGSTVVVVDNASTDDTAARVAGSFPQVALVPSHRNLGFGRACNLAAAARDSDYVLLLSPDAVVQPGCLAALLELARRRPGAGIYGGRSLDDRGRVDPGSCGGRPTLWSGFCFASGLSSVFPDNRWCNPEGIGGWARDRERTVDIVSGSLLLVRRPLWSELGGFDERFFLYAEDADLALRARALGHQPVITPEAAVVHHEERSWSDIDKQILVHRGKVTLIERSFTGWRADLARRLLRAGVALRAGLAGASSRPASDGRARPATWSQLWARRAEWQDGWPADAEAEAAAA